MRRHLTIGMKLENFKKKAWLSPGFLIGEISSTYFNSDSTD